MMITGADADGRLILRRIAASFAARRGHADTASLAARPPAADADIASY